MAGKYLILYGDIKQSKQDPDRAALADKLRTSLEKRNHNLVDCLSGRFSLRVGADEFVGVVRPGSGVLGKLISGVWWDLHPAACRMAVLKGDLDVVPSPGGDGLPPLASNFDGEAMWDADKAIRRLKSRDGLLHLDLGDTRREAKLVEALGESLYVQALRWTKNQRKTLANYLLLGSQMKVAKELKIDQPRVSRRLSSIWARTFLRGLREFQEGIDWLDLEGETEEDAQ